MIFSYDQRPGRASCIVQSTPSTGSRQARTNEQESTTSNGTTTKSRRNLTNRGGTTTKRAGQERLHVPPAFRDETRSRAPPAFRDEARSRAPPAFREAQNAREILGQLFANYYSNSRNKLRSSAQVSVAALYHCRKEVLTMIMHHC